MFLNRYRNRLWYGPLWFLLACFYGYTIGTCDMDYVPYNPTSGFFIGLFVYLAFCAALDIYFYARRERHAP